MKFLIYGSLSSNSDLNYINNGDISVIESRITRVKILFVHKFYLNRLNILLIFSKNFATRKN